MPEYKIHLYDGSDDLWPLFKEFLAASPYAGYPMQEEAILEILASAHTWVLTADDKPVGYIVCGFLEHHPYLGTTLIAHEMFWWINPEHRGKGNGLKLVKKFLDWAKEIKAEHITMGSMSTLDLDEFYTSLGFVKTEQAYLMKVK